MASQGRYAYVGFYAELADPTFMHEVDCFPTPSAVNDLVYVVDHFGGLWILRFVPPVAGE